jgi:hypothetical protein
MIASFARFSAAAAITLPQIGSRAVSKTAGASAAISAFDAF